MSILEISIENFKGIGRCQKIPLTPLTLLFGPNSAGKSTILHALNYLNDIVNRFDPDGGLSQHGSAAMDLGGFVNFVHQHDLLKSIELAITLDLEHLDIFESRANRTYRQLYETASPRQRRLSGLVNLSGVTSRITNAEFKFEISWSKQFDGPFIRSFNLSFNGNEFVSIVCSDDVRSTTISKLILDHPILIEDDPEGWKALGRLAIADRFFSDNGDAVISLMNAKHALPNWREGLEYSDVWRDTEEVERPTQMSISSLTDCLICGALETLAQELGGLRYVGPLREVPTRFRRSQSDSAAWGSGLAAWDLLAKEENTRSKVNDWLGAKHLDLGYELVSQSVVEAPLSTTTEGLMMVGVPLDRYKRLFLKDLNRNVVVFPHDVGIGISQLLPVVVGALARETQILAVEQPELHVHPRLQVALGDLFIHSATELNKLLIVETHSEHLMLRLLRRIRERNEKLLQESPALETKHLQVLYVECIEGETRITPLRVSDAGRFLDEWPHGFFAERFEEQ